MSVFLQEIKLLMRLGTQIIVHSPAAKFYQEAKSVKLAFEVYKDTETRSDIGTIPTPPLLVVHGLLGSKSNWNSTCINIQKNMKPSRKIIAVDVRNHGESPHSEDHTYPVLASDVYALLIEERLSQVVGLGHSMGGKILMYLSLMMPDLVERLIIVDISPVSVSKKLTRVKEYMEVMAAIQMPSNTKLNIARSFVDKALQPIISDKNVRNFILTNLIQKLDGSIGWKLNLSALIENYSNIFHFPIKPESGLQYWGPTTFIAGEKSDQLQSTDHSKIKQLFPNATFVTVSEAGHWVHRDKPKEFVHLVHDALQ